LSVQKLVFPDDVSFPIGKEGTNTTKYFMFEIHYDNPTKVENLTFPTGVSMFYSEEPRYIQFEVNIISIVSLMTTESLVQGKKSRPNNGPS